VIQDYAQKREIDSERHSAASNVESAIHDLRAYKEEMAIQRDLPQYDKEAIADRIALDIRRCEDEIALLQEESPLHTVPDHVLQMLVDFHESGPNHAWDRGTTPLHWAAEQGRHDIVYYILGLDGGDTLLGSHDHSGRNAVYYAQLRGHKALELWLQEQIEISGVSAQMHKSEERTFNHIPETYRKVLDQIREHGWRSMTWRDGYTMLHWAANKGHADLCAYLVELDADPNARDGQNRTPIDIAFKNSNQDLASTLQDLRTKRRQSRRF